MKYYIDDPFEEFPPEGKTKSNLKKSSSDIEIIENMCEKFEPLVKRSETDQKIIETNATVSYFSSYLIYDFSYFNFII